MLGKIIKLTVLPYFVDERVDRRTGKIIMGDDRWEKEG